MAAEKFISLIRFKTKIKDLNSDRKKINHDDYYDYLYIEPQNVPSLIYKGQKEDIEKKEVNGDIYLERVLISDVYEFSFIHNWSVANALNQIKAYEIVELYFNDGKYFIPETIECKIDTQPVDPDIDTIVRITLTFTLNQQIASTSNENFNSTIYFDLTSYNYFSKLIIDSETDTINIRLKNSVSNENIPISNGYFINYKITDIDNVTVYKSGTILLDNSPQIITDFGFSGIDPLILWLDLIKMPMIEEMEITIIGNSIFRLYYDNYFIAKKVIINNCSSDEAYISENYAPYSRVLDEIDLSNNEIASYSAIQTLLYSIKIFNSTIDLSVNSLTETEIYNILNYLWSINIGACTIDVSGAGNATITDINTLQIIDILTIYNYCTINYNS